MDNWEIHKFFYGDKPHRMSEEEKSGFRRMHEEGKKRFGSPCAHATVRNGYCVNCLRKVMG